MGLATVDSVARKPHPRDLGQGSEEACLFEETGKELAAVDVDELERAMREAPSVRKIRLVALAHRLCGDVQGGSLQTTSTFGRNLRHLRWRDDPRISIALKDALFS